MRKIQFFFIVVVAFLAGLAGAWVLQASKASDGKATVESAYDRVMRTQTIRCGYIVWTPAILKDPNTGQLSGIFYDYTQELGKALHLKIEWTEEMGWSDFPAALESGRVDAMCAGSFANSARARMIDFTQPIFYEPMYVYVRTDDTRFDNNMTLINDPAITIISVEGATTSLVAMQDFPKAKNTQLPEMTSLSESFVSLVGGKGDVVIMPSPPAREYDTHNPGKIRRVPAKAPLRFFGVSIALGGGQDRLRRMLDFATEEMLASGQVEKIIIKYDNNPDDLLRVALPYQKTETAP